MLISSQACQQPSALDDSNRQSTDEQATYHFNPQLMLDYDAGTGYMRKLHTRPPLTDYSAAVARAIATCLRGR
jgi:hypothetical protein